MGRYVTRRIVLAVITLLIVSMVVFAITQVLPGDVGRTILGQYATPEQVARLQADLGLDRPVPVRYAEWLSGFVHGDWGVSYTQNVEVRPLVLERLGRSLALAAFIFCLVVPLSIWMGVVAARHHDRTLDRAISITGMSLIALPEFVTGVFLIVVFSIELGWFPLSSQMPTGFVDVFRQFLLPAIPVMIGLFGYISRMSRTGTLDALRADYTRTAVLKGLPDRLVIRRHVLRNGLLPTITVVAVQAGYLVGGLTVVETLFNYPGLGKLIVDSATHRDILTLQACVLVIAFLYMFVNLLADLAYGLLNPRIRVASHDG